MPTINREIQLLFDSGQAGTGQLTDYVIIVILNLIQDLIICNKPKKPDSGSSPE